MIKFEEALARILESIDEMSMEKVALKRLAGRVLAAPVLARIDLPSFDNSAVDGFGVKLADIADCSEGNPARLRLSGVIRAGDSPDVKLKTGTALKILTGASVPASVDAVVMREYCEEQDGSVVVKRPASAGENIRRRGDEFLRDQPILQQGLAVTPAVHGLLANLGYDSFPVFKIPRAAVVTTGDELTKPGRPLMPGKIYDSNSYALIAALHAAGVSDCLALHAGEELRTTKRVFERALKHADVVISAGGVSVGDYDCVKQALEELGVRTEIWRIAIKPGKPVYFGVLPDKQRRRNKYVFGLPGNPVSALVTYNQLVKPAIAKMMGFANFSERKWLKATLSADLRKRAGRVEFIRARLRHQDDGSLVADPSVGQGSHMLGGLAIADALIYFPLESERLAAGSEVLVEQIQWNVV